MAYRLSNQKDPRKTLGLTTPTWYGILEIAEEHGWNPMGTILTSWEIGDFWSDPAENYDQDLGQGIYWSTISRLVIFEDALNLADALERAILAYEPQYIPSFNYYRLFGNNVSLNGTQPSLGAIQAVINLCQLGSFSIKKN